MLGYLHHGLNVTAPIYLHWPVAWNNRFSELVTHLLVSDLEIIVKLLGIRINREGIQDWTNTVWYAPLIFFCFILAVQEAPQPVSPFQMPSRWAPNPAGCCSPAPCLLTSQESLEVAWYNIQRTQPQFANYCLWDFSQTGWYLNIDPSLMITGLQALLSTDECTATLKAWTVSRQQDDN